MTENSESSSNAATSKSNLKTLLFQGLVGAATLAGTTAIPLVVNRFLNPPAPNVTPASVAPVAPQAAPTGEVQSSPENPSEANVESPQPEEENERRSKEKRNRERHKED